MIHTRTFLLCTACLALTLPTAAMATDANGALSRQPDKLTISKLGDTELSCAALGKEALAMRSIILDKQGVEKNNEMAGRGIGAAGAVGSLLLGTVTAGVGLAAAGFFATEAVDDQADKADGIKEIAAQRRSLMVGIFNAKGCEGPIEYVMRGPVEKTRPAQPDIKYAAESRTAAPIVKTPLKSHGKFTQPEFQFNE